MTYSFTVNTDASLNPTAGVAAWAAWIKSSHYLIKDSGLLQGPVPNSSVAELMAIEQALLLLDQLISSQDYLRDHRDRGKIIIYFNTDSMWSVHALRGVVKRSKHIELARRIKSLTDSYEIVPRHVKGHTKNDDSRSYVNNWCDRAARKLVREEVKRRVGTA